jgi:hypothetical protein
MAQDNPGAMELQLRSQVEKQAQEAPRGAPRVQLAEAGETLAVGHAELTQAPAAGFEPQADLGSGRIGACLDAQSAQEIGG